jgi:hypothetical protein
MIELSDYGLIQKEKGKNPIKQKSYLVYGIFSGEEINN